MNSEPTLSTRLYKNGGDGTFVDVSDISGTADNGASIGLAYVDYDRDGCLDFFVGNWVEAMPCIEMRATSV